MKLEIDDQETIDLIIDDITYEIKKHRIGFTITKYEDDSEEPISVNVTNEGTVKIDTI